ncbi:MAG: TRAP transporter large permease [Alphaproteobacteria bacterium]
MSPLIIGIVGFIVLQLLIFSKVPVAAAMAIVGLLGYIFIVGDISSAFSIASIEFSEALISTDLLVIPLFILMGGFAQISGLSSDLFRFAAAIIGHRSNGLGVASILASAGFGAICGSSVATTATMTQIAYPEMKQRGYSDKIISGALAGGGTLGSLIPPSMVMIIYAGLTEQNIIALFRAAFFPALLAIILYCLVAVYLGRKYPNQAPRSQKLLAKEQWLVFAQALPALAILILVFGGIYGSLFTITEAAAFGLVLTVLWAIYQYYRYRSFTLSGLKSMLIQSGGQIGMLYFILIGAAIYKYFLTVSGLPEQTITWVSQLSLAPIFILFIIIFLYILLGAVFDSLAAMVITIPFTFPLIIGLGYNPIWWGIINVVIIEIGLITPPVGMNLFVIQSMRPNISISQIYKGITSYVIADIFRVFILLMLLVYWV